MSAATQAKWYKRNFEARSCNYFFCGTVISITYSECVSVALVSQQTKRMRPIILLCDLSGSTIFSTLTHKRQDFREKITEQNMCVLILSTDFVCNVSHFQKNGARYHHIHWSSRKAPVILFRF
jgi:hypothetical protein